MQDKRLGDDFNPFESLFTYVSCLLASSISVFYQQLPLEQRFALLPKPSTNKKLYNTYFTYLYINSSIYSCIYTLYFLPTKQLFLNSISVLYV